MTFRFSWILSLLILGLGPASAHANYSDLYAPPLPAREELLEQHPVDQTIWLLLQLGDEPTSSTKAHAFELQRMGYAVEVRTVSVREMLQNLDAAADEGVIFRLGPGRSDRVGTASRWLGLMEGMAFRFPLARSPAVRLADFKAGAVTAIIAGGATHFGFISTSSFATPPPYPVMAAVTMAIWYGVTTYYHEWMRLFSNQGVTLTEHLSGRWQAVRGGARFRNLSLLIKSLVQNVLVFTAGHQELQVVLEDGNAWKLSENSLLSMLARSLPEQLIHESLEREAQAEVTGEAHFRRARNLRVAYESIHIFLKTVHLFQIPYLEYGYYGLATAGAAASIYRVRFSLFRRLERLLAHLRSVMAGQPLPNTVCEASFAVARPVRREAP